MSSPRTVVLVIATAATALVLTLDGTAVAAQPQVGLGVAAPYAVLAGSTVTNTGPSVISGSLGVSPGSAVTGFPPGTVNAGTIHAADATALQAKNALTTAYNDAAGRSPVVDKTSQDLGGQLLLPGVYAAASEMALTGTVTLDAQGDPDAVFVFKAGSTLITASNSTVALTGGAQACNVFWQVGSSATIGTTTVFVGSVLALTDISLLTGAIVQGRMLARNGQVSLDSNTITRPGCAAAAPSPSASATATTNPTASPSSRPGNGPGGSPTGPGSTPAGPLAGGPTPGDETPGPPTGPGGDTPIPTGHPHTGQLPGTPGAGWLLLGLLCLGGAAGAAIRGSRRTAQPRR